MARIERFEDLEVWQKSRELCNDIYLATDAEYFSKDFALRDQVRKSCISIPSNIAEGFERESNNPVHIFFTDSQGFSRRAKNTNIYCKKQELYNKYDF